MMYWGNGVGGWGMTFMILSGLLFWGVLVTGVVLLVRAVGHGARAEAPAIYGATPQEVLADRFARGEIDDDEYAHRLEVLDRAASGTSLT